MNVGLINSVKSFFVRKTPKVVETVAKEVAPVVKKEAPAIRFMPADKAMTYLSDDMKEIVSKYNAKVACDKSATYLSYRKNPNVHIRATYSPEGALISKDFRFADGRTMRTKGVTSYGAYSNGSSLLIDKNGEIIKKVEWKHKPEVGYVSGGKPNVKTIETSISEEFYNGGKLDHGRTTKSVYGVGAKNPIVNGSYLVVDRTKDIKEYSIPLQRQVDYSVYGEYDTGKVFTTKPKISTYIKE